MCLMKKQKTQSNRRIWRWILITMIPLVLGLLIGFYYAIVNDLPPAESISFFAPPIVTNVYDDQGEIISQFFIERISPIIVIKATMYFERNQTYPKNRFNAHALYVPYGGENQRMAILLQVIVRGAIG